MDKTMNGKFSVYQLEQINMAKEICPEAVPVLKNNPQWSSTLMNIVFNRVKEKKDYSKMVEFAEASSISEPEESGCIGGFEMLYRFLYAEDNNITDFAIDLIKKDNTINPDEFSYKLIRNSEGISDSVYDIRRVHIDDEIEKRSDLIMAAMSEGVPEAKSIIRKIEQQAQYLSDCKISIFGIENGTISPYQAGKKVMDALDDMNIRGKQIVYAFEYCDNDIGEFVRRVGSRDCGMVAYVNSCMLCEGVAHKQPCVPKAVVHDAVHIKGRLPVDLTIFTGIPEDIKKYLPCPDKLRVPYSMREIYNGTDTDTAIKIVESLGFNKAFNEKLTDTKHRPDDGRCIIYYHPDGAIFYALHAKEDNISYGECEIIVTTDSFSARAFSIHAETNRVKEGVSKSRIFASDGKLISTYKKFTGTALNEIADIGYGLQGIPLPRTFSLDYIPIHSDRHKYKYKSIRDICNSTIYDSLAYSLSEIADCIMLKDCMGLVPQDARFLYDKFFDDPYKSCMEYSYFNQGTKLNSLVLGAVFELLKVPDEECEKYMRAAIEAANKESFFNCKNCTDKWISDTIMRKNTLVHNFIDDFHKELEVFNHIPHYGWGSGVLA